MKDKVIRVTVSTAIAGLSAYFGKMVIPVFVLLFTMIADYISGVAAAWYEGTLNSKIGKRGVLKKVCYMLLVVASGIVDWVICSGLENIGIYGIEMKYYFGLTVTIWLILNELLSILENCTRMGVPIPKFIRPMANRLKIMIDEKNSDRKENEE